MQFHGLPYPVAIMPWMDEGSLEQYLAGHEVQLREKLSFVSEFFGTSIADLRIDELYSH